MSDEDTTTEPAPVKKKRGRPPKAAKAAGLEEQLRAVYQAGKNHNTGRGHIPDSFYHDGHKAACRAIVAKLAGEGICSEDALTPPEKRAAAEEPPPESGQIT